MRIERVRVTGLFDCFNHDLRLKPNEPIAIIYGPNGFGKTWTLRILNGLFNQSLGSLTRLPFRQVSTWFDDRSVLNVHREATAEGPRGGAKVTLQYSGEEDFEVPLLNFDDLDVPFNAIDEIVPELDQIGPKEWRHLQTGERLDIDDVLARFGDQLPFGSEVEASFPPWLEKIRSAIPVRFIDTERLRRSLPQRNRPRHRALSRRFGKNARTVRSFSTDLRERVRETLAQYGVLSQSLDRTFPGRLVAAPQALSSAANLAALREELDSVTERRTQLVQAGLLAEEKNGWAHLQVPNLEGLDPSQQAVLKVYSEDAKEKFGVFDDLYKRVDILKRIANSRLLYKTISVGSEGLGVVARDGSSLDLELLSSGEQHELVLLYELLFLVQEDSLILIDEPELSFHVDWQAKFLDDLASIAELGAFRVLLATHSPQIIDDRWDLTIRLEGPEDV